LSGGDQLWTVPVDIVACTPQQGVDGDVSGVDGIVVAELSGEHAHDLFEQGLGNPVGQISPDESFIYGPPQEGGNSFMLPEPPGA
jgi:hypothetical protein